MTRLAALVLVVLAGCAQGACPECPTASLLANGASSVTVGVGDQIAYAWDSANADSATSTVAMHPTADRCGNKDGPWVVSTLHGSSDPAPVLACQAGITYTLTFEVGASASSETASAAVTIDVR